MGANLNIVVSHSFKDFNEIIDFQNQLNNHSWPIIEELERFLSQAEDLEKEGHSNFSDKIKHWNWEFFFWDSMSGATSPQECWEKDGFVKIRTPNGNIAITHKMAVYDSGIRWNRILEDLDLRLNLKNLYFEVAKSIDSEFILFLPDATFHIASIIYEILDLENPSPYDLIQDTAKQAGKPTPWENTINEILGGDDHAEKLENIYFLEMV